MAKQEIVIRLRVDDKGNLKVATKQTEKLSKSTDKAARSTERLQKSRDKYNRTEKGVAQISSNSTKNFSKMQQSIGGEGGSGGLVRAYALLAANVFALTAAFGVLSRASQVEVLIESIERLEVVSGKSVTAVGRDLQASSRGALDFASSLRSVSLASSAGFNSAQIQELGEVATNASVALGRNLADGLDRIFRGVIKVEPELLDEIGLFVRVNEAATKYAARLGIAATDLTEFQKRQAFANEAIEQGQRKFSVFSDIDPAPLDRLSAALIDLSQSALSLITGVVNPILEFVLNNVTLLIGAFGGIVFALLRQVVPALGTFGLNAQKAAEQARKNVVAVQERIQAQMKETIQQQIREKEELLKTAQAAKQLATEKRKAAESGLGGAEAKLQGKKLARAKTEGGAADAAEARAAALEKSRRTSTKARIDAEQAALRAEAQANREILSIKAEIAALEKGQAGDAAKNSLMRQAANKADIVAMRASKVATIGNIAANRGLKAAFAELTLQIKAAAAAQGQFVIGSKAMNVAVISIKGSLALLSAAFTKFTGVIGAVILVLSFLPAIFKTLLKMTGMATDATEEFNTTYEKSDEIVEKFTSKLQQAAETMADLEMSGTKVGEAILAENTAISEAGQALIDTRTALNQVVAERGAFTNFFTDMFGATLADEKEFLQDLIAQGKLSDEALRALEAGGTDTSGITRINAERKARDDALLREAARLNEIKKIRKEIADGTIKGTAEQIKNFKKIGQLEELNKKSAKFRADQTEKINKLAKDLLVGGRDFFEGGAEDTGVTNAIAISTQQATASAKAGENLKSAIAGTRDAADELNKSFITKTIVDKPLTSLIQLRDALDESRAKSDELLVSTEERKQTIDAIRNGENAVIDLLSKEKRTIVENEKTTQQEILDILAEATQQYFTQQLILGRNKKLITEIGNEQKIFKNIAKESAEGIKLQSILNERKLSLDRQILQTNRDLAVKGAEITESQFNQLLKAEEQGTLLEELKGTEAERNKIIKAIGEQRALEIKEREIALSQLNSIKQVEIDQFNLQLKTVAAQEKLNKTLDETATLRAKAENVARGRGQQLSKGKELQLEIESFNRSADLVDQRLKTEVNIAKLRAEMMTNELQTAQTIANIRLNQIALEIRAREDSTDADLALAERAEEMAKTQLNLTDFTAQMNANIEQLGTAVGNSARQMLLNVQDLTGIFQLPEDDIVTLSRNLGEEIAARTGKAAAEARKTAIARLQEESEKQRKLGLVDEDGQTQADRDLSKMGLGTDFNEDGTLKKIGKIRIEALSAASAISKMSEGFADFGPDGKVAQAMGGFAATLAASVDAFAGKEPSNKVAAIGALLGGVANIMTARSERQIANIDKEIAAEKKRDGKSKESIEKIKQMEAKKEAIARKQFEMQKKMQIAMTIASTATAVMQTMAASGVGFFATPLAMIVAAMGAAQVALIARQKFEGGTGDTAAEMAAPSNLKIGARGNEVDVSQRANRGELAFLRGEQGTGNISNFTPVAAGRKGYAMGSEGVVVGERGPEVITPSMPIDITPNDKIGAPPMNVNFTINAVDAAGLEQTIQSQRGNIIGMIREAANGYGENFLEQVDIDTLDTTGGSY